MSRGPEYTFGTITHTQIVGSLNAGRVYQEAAAALESTPVDLDEAAQAIASGLNSLAVAKALAGDDRDSHADSSPIVTAIESTGASLVRTARAMGLARYAVELVVGADEESVRRAGEIHTGFARQLGVFAGNAISANFYRRQTESLIRDGGVLVVASYTGAYDKRKRAESFAPLWRQVDHLRAQAQQGSGPEEPRR